MAEELPVSLTPSDRMIPLVFDQNQKFLVKYPYRERWLSETKRPGFLLIPSKIHTDESLFEGRAGSGVFFRRNLITWNTSLSETWPLFFRLKYYCILLFEQMHE
jgi:hypothetical protein